MVQWRTTYSGPAFVGDADKYGEHGQTDVVEVRDAKIRSFPAVMASVIWRTLVT